MRVMRLAGAATVLALVGFIVVMLRRERARGSTGSPRANLPPSARPELVDQPPRFALRRSAEALAKAEGRGRS
jgi:hypothetical protein